METRRLDTPKSNARKLNDLISYRGQIPRLHPSVFVVEGAKIIGDVEIEEKSSIWLNTVVRGDVNYIRIGTYTNVQDNSVLCVTTMTVPLHIGSNVTIGHSAILHGYTADDCCLIGMGAIVLEGFNVPEGMLVAGVPAKIKRSLTEEEKQFLHRSAANYVCYRDNNRS